MKKFITLMLCCSVQCDNNERYINKIKDMDKEWQVELMALIKDVCTGRSCVPMPMHAGNGLFRPYPWTRHGRGGL
jgi:hypothetical protein